VKFAEGNTKPLFLQEKPETLAVTQRPGNKKPLEAAFAILASPGGFEPPYSP
jgi:hypothetical protein